MGTETDKCERAIEASVIRVDQQLDRLASELNQVSGSLAKIDNSSLEQLFSSFDANALTDRINALTGKMTGVEVGSVGELYLTDFIGLDPQKIMDFQSSIASVTNTVGLCEETSRNASKALGMLAVDFSALKNIDLETVMTNLQSGLLGQSEALSKYGVDIKNAMLQTYALKEGIGKSVSEMTQAEKMQLRLLAILDQSKAVWGNQVNTIRTIANQYYILQQQISNLARIIGNLFLPVVSKVIPVVNGFVIAVQRLFSVLGVKLFGGDWLKDIRGESGSGLDNLADSAEEVAGGLDDAAGSAGKLKGQLQSFDALNVIDMQRNSGGGSGAVSGGLIDLTGAIADALSAYEAVWNKAFQESQNRAQEIANKIISAFEPGDFHKIGSYLSGGIANGLRFIDWDAICRIGRSIGEKLAQFMNGLITPELFGEIGRTIARVLNTAIYTALSFAGAIDWTNLGLSIAGGINILFETFDFAAFAETVNTWVQGLFQTLTTAIANIDWLTVYDGIITFLEKLDIETVGIIIGAMTIKKILGLHLGAKVVGAIGSEISKSLAGVIGSKLGLDLAEGAGLGAAFGRIGKQMGSTFMIGFKELFSGSWITGAVPEAISAAGISPIIGKLTGIGTIISGATIAVTNFFSMWKDGFSWLKEILMVIGIAIAGVGAVILGAAAGAAAIVGAIIAAVSTAVIMIHDNWDAIYAWFAGLAEWFNANIVVPVKEFFRGLWESISGFFMQLWEDICGIWSAVSEWFNGYVIEPIAEFFQGLKERVQQIFEGLWIIVQAVWIVVSDWFSEHVIEPVVVFFQSLWERVSGFFSQLWADICAIWSTVSEWFNEHVITPVVLWFQGLWEKVSGFFSQLWEDICGIWSTVSEWFSTNIITPLSEMFSTFKEKAIGIFDGIWDGIKKGVVGAMNAVIGAIEASINWIVNAINYILKGFNKVVSWAAKVAEVDWGGVDLVPQVSLSRISMYESGGFPNTGELFMARENGINEMVGRMGNRNAVANNGQIVEGIVIGVESANAEQNALLREQNQLLRQLLAKETGITSKQVHAAVKSEDAIYAKMNGHSAFAY